MDSSSPKKSNEKSDRKRKEIRAEKIAKKQEETGITEEMIKELVYTFYDKIRVDPVLGPIFNEKITDWNPHLEIMCKFWSSATLKSGKYNGNPLPKHVNLDIDARFFDYWLELFALTADEVCPPLAATVFKEKSTRIAGSLELGVAIKNGILPIAGKRYINDKFTLSEV